MQDNDNNYVNNYNNDNNNNINDINMIINNIDNIDFNNNIKQIIIDGINRNIAILNGNNNNVQTTNMELQSILNSMFNIILGIFTMIVIVWLLSLFNLTAKTVETLWNIVFSFLLILIITIFFRTL